MLFALHAVLVAALLGLCLTAWANRRAMPRLEPADAPVPPTPRVSVLVPARNEAAKIELCVRSWASQSYPSFEILVYDDQSTDDTAARAAAAGGDRIRVVSGKPLPEGWRGKQHACHQLRAEASGDLLVFADADVTAAPDTLRSAVALLDRLQLGFLSALPRHASPSLLLRALVSIQNWTALTFVPSWLAAVSKRATFAAVNGQFVAVRPDVYDAVGGFAAVRDAVTDDVALGRLLATRGVSAPLVDGSSMLTCRPYENLRQVWSANTRHLLPIFFDSAPLLLTATALLALVYVGPFALVAIGLAGAGTSSAAWVFLPLAEIALGLFQRRLVDAWCGYPAGVTLLHPTAAGALLPMAVGSVVRYRLRRTVEWRGRNYRVAR